MVVEISGRMGRPLGLAVGLRRFGCGHGLVMSWPKGCGWVAEVGERRLGGSLLQWHCVL